MHTRKLKQIFLILLSLISIVFLSPQKVSAQIACQFSTKPSWNLDDPSKRMIKNTAINGIDSLTYFFSYNKNDLLDFTKNFKFPGQIWINFSASACVPKQILTINNQNDIQNLPNPLSFTLDRYGLEFCNAMLEPGDKLVGLHYSVSGKDHDLCNKQNYSIDATKPSCNVEAVHDPNTTGDIDDTTWKLKISEINIPKPKSITDPYIDALHIYIDDEGRVPDFTAVEYYIKIPDPISRPIADINWPIPNRYITSEKTAHTVKVKNFVTFGPGEEIMCETTFNPYPRGVTATPTPSPTITPTPPTICFTLDGARARAYTHCGSPYNTCPWCHPTPTEKPKKPAPPPLTALCDQLTDKEPARQKSYRQQCEECVGSKSKNPTGKLWTALGCVPINYTAFISDIVLKTGVGISGGIAFLYFLYGAFMILTSTGNAERMEEAKQIITSSLAGLLLIIFSIFLLQVIGVQILQLPGFGP